MHNYNSSSESDFQNRKNHIGILLLHGLTGMPSEMRPVEKHFRQLGYIVSAPVLAGHGSTNDDLLNCKWQDWLSGVLQARDELLAQCEKIIICGLSMGASLATLIANDERVIGLILLSPTLAYDGSGINSLPSQRHIRSRIIQSILHLTCSTFPLVGKICYWTESPPYGLQDERLQRQITKAIEAAKRGESNEFGLFRTYFTSLHQMNYLSDEFRAKAKYVKCPALIIHSLEDTIATIFNATETYAKLGTKDKCLTFLTGCDHVMTLDLKRKQVINIIDNFTQRVVSGKKNNELKPADNKPFLTVTVEPLVEFNETFHQLFPHESQSAKLTEYMHKLGPEFVDFHSIIVKNNNTPIILLPTFLSIGRLSNSWSDFVEKSALIFGTPVRLLARINLFGIGITEKELGIVGISNAIDANQKNQAWQLCLKVTKALSNSLRAKIVFLKDLNASNLDKIKSPHSLPIIKKQAKVVNIKRLEKLQTNRK
jgi:carboxylesterase